jgi:type II secretory pathway pseudopilin PulG
MPLSAKLVGGRIGSGAAQEPPRVSLLIQEKGVASRRAWYHTSVNIAASLTASDWIALAGAGVALIGVLSTAGVSLVSLRYTDRQRSRELEERERTEQRAADQARRAAGAEWRRSLVVSLLPLLRLLNELPLMPDADNATIAKHVDRLRSESMDRAIEAVAYVGLVYPSMSARHASGYVSATITSALAIEEAALRACGEERKHLLQAAAGVLTEAETKVRDLAFELAAPLTADLGLDVDSVEALVAEGSHPEPDPSLENNHS